MSFSRLSLRDVWEEAKHDLYSSNLDADGYEARLVYGIKIVYDIETKRINIYNTARGGDFYNEVNNLYPFIEGGWRYGVYITTLENYKHKLDRIEDAIREEVNATNNPKQITSLKNARLRILNKYNRISDKLNKL